MRVALVLNAPELDIEVREEAVIAADGGYRHVRDKNVIALIGDFDTLDEIPKGINIIKYPAEKDATDGELAIDYIKELGADEVVIYGGFGGKLEHILGNLNLLSYADSLGIPAMLVGSGYRAYFSRGSFRARVAVGDIVSVFPKGGDALVSSSEGLYYPLRDLVLKSNSSRGISNVATQEDIALEVARGAVIVLVRPR